VRFRFVGLACIWLAAGFASAAAWAQDDFYKGKQLRLVVSTDAGGAYDTYARLASQILKEYIPGNPTIIVQNMPGAGGLKAANYIATTAPRDGTVIAATHAGILTAGLTSPAAAIFDAARLSWIGSITTDPFVGYVWHTTPIKTLADMRTTEVVMGGVAVGTASTDYGIVARDLFGLKLKLVNGYKSSNDVKLAMERGEVQGAFANGWSSLRNAAPDWIRDGKIRIVVQHGFKPLPDLPDIPLFTSLARTDADREALVFMLARQEAAKPYFGPPDLPVERLAILRRAFDATMHDPRFLALAAKASVTVDGPMTGEELAALVVKVSKTSPDVVALINSMLAEKK
jgi:tripartite-type tricarboxylate transporter receptor subunit TctC